MIEEKDLSLSIDLPDEPLPVEGDSTRLAQVLGNLLQNAARFTDSGGSVAVRAWAEPENGRAVVSVKDTGIGIEPALQARVFDAFTRGDLSTDRSRGGLGLGLALVKGLVDLHRGGVSVTSEGPDCGAEFTFWLPLAGSG